MIRLLRKDTVCASSANVCHDISGLAWNFGHEWLKGDGDRSLSTWHDMLTAVVPRLRVWLRDSKLLHNRPRDLDGRKWVFLIDAATGRDGNCVSQQIASDSMAFANRWRYMFSRKRNKIYHEPIIFNEINNRYLQEEEPKKDQSPRIYTLRPSLAICLSLSPRLTTHTSSCSTESAWIDIIL